VANNSVRFVKKDYEPHPSPRPVELEPGSSNPRSEREKESRLKLTLEYVGLLIAPTTLLTALAFYFGWALTSARSLYFGIDPSTLDYSTQDYVLRSTDALFVPLTAIVIAGLVAIGFHALMTSWIASGRQLRLLRFFIGLGILFALTLFLIGVGVVFGLGFPRHYLLRPMSPGVGAVALLYMLWLWAQLSRSEWRAPPSSRGVFTAAVAFVLSLALLSAFWTTSSYAKVEGGKRAARLAENLTSRPRVIVLSAKRLLLNGLGITEAKLHADSPYRFRYSGLRLLVRSNHRYFLVSDRWSRSHGVAIVLPESDNLRFEFRPGG